MSRPWPRPKGSDGNASRLSGSDSQPAKSMLRHAIAEAPQVGKERTDQRMTDLARFLHGKGN